MSERARTINERAIFTIGILIIAVAGLFVSLTSFADNAYAQTASSNNVAVVNEQTQVTLSGTNSFTPVPGNTITYYWQQMSGDSVSFTNNGPTITFTTPAVSAGDTKYLRFALIITDNHGATSSTAFTLQVVHVNVPPTVVTQHELVVPESSQVTLSGTGTSPDNYPLTYQWTQTSGDNVTLSTPDQPTATFTAPAVGSAPSKTLQFKLTADDGHGGQGSDYETVTVMSSSYYSSPSINCGSIMGGARGYTVALQASVNNPANLPLSYSWTQVSGLPVQLSSADTLNPTFTVPNGPDASELAFQLTVSNGQTQIGFCESYVYTQLGFAMPPVANAGPDRTVNGLDQITLDGTKSTGVGSLSYSWKQVLGVPVQLLYAGTATPQFVAPDVPVGSTQVLVFELQVTNGLGKSADQVQITVIHPNVPPTAVITMQ
ncbi:MAG: PKD domain-containing protein [Nitrosotalea sp.]